MPSAFRAAGALNWSGPCDWCFDVSSYFFVGQALSNDTRKSQQEAVSIITEPLVESKRFFVQITERVPRLNRNMRAGNAALQKSPEIFNPVRVNRTLDVSFGMTYKVMDEAVLRQGRVRAVFVGIDRRSGQCGLFDNRPHIIAPIRWDRTNLDLTLSFLVAMEHAKNGLFAETASPALETGLAFVPMHIASLRADVSFIDFDSLTFTAHRFNRTALESKADTVPHVPSGLLGDSKCAVKFPRTDTVLGVGDEPERSKPFVQWNRAVLENGADLYRKLLLALKALPNTAGAQVARALCPAVAAFRLAIGPSKTSQKLYAKVFVREVNNSLLECFR